MKIFSEDRTSKGSIKETRKGHGVVERDSPHDSQQGLLQGVQSLESQKGKYNLWVHITECPFEDQ